ncbi:MAG: sodium:calcium antiporter [Actinomycetota bacterium]|nr:sodium:calcium antiporter [Actinomycetota bacterium]
MLILWLLIAAAGVGAIVWGAEAFAEHLAVASARLGVSTFALAVLLAGAEPEELATAVTASLRHAPAIALGDVIGANVAMCLVALGIGAVLSPLPFDRQARRYALWGLPAGALAAVVAWDGRVTRPEAILLIGTYFAFVATIWVLERRPPAMGETAEVGEAAAPPAGGAGARIGRELGLVVAGVAAMAIGATALVEGVRRVSNVESTQTRLGLVVVGFATAFELVVLAWSVSRRGISAAVVAGVVGSFTYNATMTLGAGALAHPLQVVHAGQLHGPWLMMLAALAIVVALAWPSQRLRRPAGVACLALYVIFVAVVALA